MPGGGLTGIDALMDEWYLQGPPGNGDGRGSPPRGGGNRVP